MVMINDAKKINIWKTCKNLDKNARHCDGKIT